MTDPHTVETASGLLAGHADPDGIVRFLGVPFAAPPVGPLRFRPPQPPARWDGVREASAHGPTAPQNPSLMDMLFGNQSEPWDEDCLYLNVYTPGADDGRRPVMVWVHGGGFEMGSGSFPLYEGTEFARDGVVFVSVNYRLGAFGFLELGHLDPDYAGSGNLGLLDQIAALEWVRDNIAAFGGDPERVTVFGESAGAMSVSLLMAMPRARGLFRRVVAQSGAASAAKPLDHAVTDADEFLAAAGLDSVAAAVAAPAAALLAGHAAMSASRIADPEAVVERTGNPLAFLPFRPVADGVEVPLDPLGAIAAGAAAGVELMVGTNLEEWNLFALMSPHAADDESLRRRLQLLVADPGAAVEAYRRVHAEATPAALEAAMLTDVIFTVPAVRLAHAHCGHGPTWRYRFDWRSPAWGGSIGAAHAVEIPFVFDCVHDPRLAVLVGEAAPRQLARSMHEAWVAFATDGAPVEDADTWPAVSAEHQPVRVFDTDIRLEVDPDHSLREFWDSPDGALRLASV